MTLPPISEKPLQDEPDHRDDALWMAGYEQGVAEGVKMGTALMDQVRTAARELVRAWHDGERVSMQMLALEALVETE